MKLKNILISLAVIISSLLITTVKADTAPNSFVIRASDLTMLYGSNYLGNGSTLNFTYKKTSTGKIVYCTEIHDTMTSTSETYTLGRSADAKFAYVLANGYPSSTITGNSYKDYYITGLAIWYLIKPTDSVFTYFNLSAGTYKGVGSQVVREVAKLVNGAYSYSYANPTIRINSSSSNLTLSSDKKYYVSNAMSVSVTGGITSYNVSLSSAPTGTIITDANGNKKTTFSTGEKFIVKVPVSSIKQLSTSLSVSASATGYVYTAYIYNPSVSSHQSLITAYSTPKTVSASTKLNVNVTTKVEINKIDADTKKALAGATLVLTSPDGTKTTWVTETTAKVFNNLKFGKYTITETKAPSGYKTSSETITFELTATNTSFKAEFKNYKDIKTTISKQDATTGKELPGATLELTYPDGKKTTWVSTNEPKVFTNLPAGKYTLKETIAPKGYILSEEKVTFTINANGKVDNPPVMKNYPLGKTTISKQDATTGKELPGATLVLKDANGNQIDKWVSGNTPHLVENLKPGKYTLSETIAPKGYVLSKETVTFTVNKYGKVDNPPVMKNSPEGKTTISKQDATTGKELPGATLELTYPDGKKTTWVSTNEPKVFTNLPAGKYILKETIAPEGYILSEETVTFTVDKNGNVAKPVVMKNYPFGKTTISKQDATTGKELPGATLELKDEKGTVIDKWVSTNEPHLVENLKPGKYTLTETIAPEGYKLSTETVTFTVDEKGKVSEPPVMKNYPQGSVLISKQDITSKEELYGAHLELRDEKGNLIESWTSGKEPHKIEDLEAGKYYLTETQAPDGYILSKETIEFEVDELGNVKDKDLIIMYNERIPDVPVPKTSSFKTITTSIIGIITMVFGAMIIQRTYKKNEEK